MATANDELRILAPVNTVAVSTPVGTPAGYLFNDKVNSAYLLLLGLFP